ncbi:MAG: tryptophan synthase subunit alpha [Syntrophales bacterium LBB04]|nr:tryptophan synthase subunit alpha [Syntrophales bacterium LBB04]
MSRVGGKFSELRKKGDKALIAYITAGDPSLQVTEELSIAFAAAGVDIMEIGVPFSDPTADGPVIQDAARRALKTGVTLESVLLTVEKIRQKSDIPIVLFGYYNPIFAYDAEKFADKAKESGVDAVLVVDLPHEEALELRKYTDPCGIDFISLIAPTTGDERIKKISAQAGGFLYYISVTGITGTTRPDVGEIKKGVARLRAFTNLPVVVGFGISTPKQAGEIAPHADGVVVGSAFVRLIEENSCRENLVSLVAQYAHDIKKSMLMSP